VSRPATGVIQLAGRLALGWFYCRRRRPAGPASPGQLGWFSQPSQSRPGPQRPACWPRSNP